MKKNYPELELLKFTPFCKNCLKIDDNFSNVKVEGRCLENDIKCCHKEDLTLIADEIASCIVLLIVLAILYTIKNVKKEISQRLQ